MSTTIDHKVVEMRFDNKQFEQGAQTTLSTLDKLKQSLNFTGASKSLENVSAAANKVDMNGLGRGVDAIRVKFSALQIAGTTAIANLTNSVVNAGKRMTKALTIDPIKTGFSEYETKINAVQTIMANVSSKGKTISDVTKVLNELNTYADKTIYNFAEMTKNIGTFTAAGVGLEESASAIQGISNLAAASGSTSQQASTAMYQLSQALSAGTVKLMDWNSVVNAGMGGQKFQDALKRTAREHGVNVDAMIKKNGSFRESLQEGWITADILNTTLNNFTVDGAKKYSEAMVKSGKYTKKQAEALVEEARVMEDAATKVKTFTQLWDTLKESAQSGWTQTWETVIGDFEEAKSFLSQLYKKLSAPIEAMAERRNALVEGALGDRTGGKWDAYIEKVNKAGIKTKDFENALIKTARKHNIAIDDMIKEEGSFEKTLKRGWLTKGILTETLTAYVDKMTKAKTTTEDMNKKLKEFQKVVDDVWAGKYGNDKSRIEKLTDAGYKYSEVQALVNKTVDGHKLKLEDLSKSQLKSVGCTDKQIEAITKLKEEAEGSGKSIDEMLDSLQKVDGRTLLIDSLSNIIEAISKPLKAIKEAWDEIFPSENGNRLYDLIEGFHDITEAMVITEEQAENFKKVFEGLFAILSIGNMFFTKSLNTILKILKTVLEEFDTDLIEVAAALGEYAVKLRNWIAENTVFLNGFEKIGTIIATIITGIIKLVKAAAGLDIVSDLLKTVENGIKKIFNALHLDFNGVNIDGLIQTVKSAFTKVENYIKGLDSSEAVSVGVNFVKGVVKGVTSGVASLIKAMLNLGNKMLTTICGVLGIESPSKEGIEIGKFFVMGIVKGSTLRLRMIAQAMLTIGETMLNTLRNFLGIHSPSTEGIEIGRNLITGIINGIFSLLPQLVDTITVVTTNILTKLRESEIDFGKLFVMGSIVAILAILWKLSAAFKVLTAPLRKFSDLIGAAEGALKSFSDGFTRLTKAKALEAKSEALLNLAKAIGILAASVALLASIDTKQLFIAIGAITILIAEMVALTIVASKMDIDGFGKVSILLISIGAAMLIMAGALKMIASIKDYDDAWRAVGQLGIIMAMFMAFLAIYGKCVDSLQSANLLKAGGMMIMLAISVGLMAKALKALSEVTDEEVKHSLKTMLGVTVVFGLFIALSKFSGQYANKAGSLLLKMVLAMSIMAGVIKIIAEIPDDELEKGLVNIAKIEAIFLAFILASEAAGPHAAKAGVMLLAMSAAMAILVYVIKQFKDISNDDLNKAMVTIAKIEAVFLAFIFASSVAGERAIRAGVMLLLMATAIGILAVTIKLIASISSADIDRGIIVVSSIGVLFAAMIAVSKYAGEHADKAGNMLLKMSVAILLLVGAIALLSFLKPKDIAVATAAIVMLLGCFAGIIAVTSIAKDCMKSLIVMAVVIGMLMTALYLLAKLDNKQVINASTSIVLVMGMFALLIKAASTAAGAIPVLLVLTAAVGVIGLVLYKIATLPVKETFMIAGALSTLLLALALSFRIISTSMGPAALASVGGLLGVVVALGLVAGILYLMNKFNIKPSIETATALSILLLSLSVACVILAGVGAAGTAAIAGALALDGVILAIGLLIVSLGALVTEFPKIKEFVNNGVDLLCDLFSGIGRIITSFVSGLAEGFLYGLPKMGTYLGEFMDNAKPFFDAVGDIDKDAAEGTKCLAEAILILTKSGFTDGLSNLFTGGSSLTNFADQLVPFGEAMVKYSNAVAGIDTNAITASATAGKALAELANNLPNSGGLAGIFAGENDMIMFCEQLAPFGAALRDYSYAVIGTNYEAVQNSAKAAKALVEVANNIPNTGGMASWFAGENDIDTFSSRLIAFGKNINKYSESVEGIDAVAIDNSAEAVKALSKLANNLPNSGGMVSWFTGDNDLSAFSGKLVALGNGLVSYSVTVTGINLQSITTSVTAVKSLSSMMEDLKGIDTSGVKTFTKSLNTLTKSGIRSALSQFDASTSKFKSTGTDMVNSLANGMKAKHDSLYATSMYLAGKITTAFEKEEKKAVTAAKNIAIKMKQAIRDQYDSFKQAGEWLGSGLVVGINAKQEAAYWAGYRLGQKAVEGEKDGQNSNSPSKDTIKAGKWIGEGLIIGMNRMGKSVYAEGKSLGETSIRSISSALRKAGKIVDGGIDVNPRIRPILDLSDVESGVGAINGMFGLSPSIGVMSNIGAISSMMNSRNQNGSSDDVVRAIDKLGRNLGNLGNNTTNYINGINADGDAAVVDAIDTLVRAATVGRRK